MSDEASVQAAPPKGFKSPKVDRLLAKEKERQDAAEARRIAARKPTGRPRKELSEAQMADLEILAEAGATREEMASFLGMSSATLQKRLRDQPEVFAVLVKAGARLKAGIRRKQVQVAMTDGHPAQATMLVWLGKTVLGQSDRLTLKIESTEDALSQLKSIWPEINEDEMMRQLTEPIDVEATVKEEGGDGAKESERGSEEVVADSPA